MYTSCAAAVLVLLLGLFGRADGPRSLASQATPRQYEVASQAGGGSNFTCSAATLHALVPFLPSQSLVMSRTPHGSKFCIFLHDIVHDTFIAKSIAKRGRLHPAEENFLANGIKASDLAHDHAHAPKLTLSVHTSGVAASCKRWTCACARRWWQCGLHGALRGIDWPTCSRDHGGAASLAPPPVAALYRHQRPQRPSSCRGHSSWPKGGRTTSMHLRL